MTDPKPRTLSPRETACVMMHRALRRGELAASDLRPRVSSAACIWPACACERTTAWACPLRRRDAPPSGFEPSGGAGPADARLPRASDLRPWQRQACVRLADAGACHVRRDAAGIIYYLDTDND